MAKEDKPLFLKALLLVVIILLLNTGAFSLLYKDNFSTGFSGRAVKQVATNAYQNTSKLSKIFLLSQWGLLLAFLVTAFVRDRVVAKSSKKLTNVKVTKSTPSKTDLDTLYELLKKRKQLNISGIAKTFKVSKEVALGWAKTLESSDLAIIDYPGIGGPIVKVE